MEEIVLKLRPNINRPEAEGEARKKLPPDAVLLAWFDRDTKAGSPQGPGAVSEKYLDDYARARGGKAKVVVNERFAFFYMPAPSR